MRHAEPYENPKMTGCEMRSAIQAIRNTDIAIKTIPAVKDNWICDAKDTQ